jgi:hypothetical protein
MGLIFEQICKQFLFEQMCEALSELESSNRAQMVERYRIEFWRSPSHHPKKESKPADIA